jgi:hypothetical protein
MNLYAEELKKEYLCDLCGKNTLHDIEVKEVYLGNGYHTLVFGDCPCGNNWVTEIND